MTRTRTRTRRVKGGGKGGRKKGVNDVEAEENTPSSTNRRPLAEPLQPRAPARAVAGW